MNYNYHCFDCEKVAIEEHADKLVKNGDGLHLPPELYEEFVLFETSHAMKPTKKELREATECPRCKGHNCEQTFYGSNVTSYVRGYGYLDRKGAKRDMNRYKLNMADPYAPYRVSGEVDHINKQLDREGQHQPNRKHFGGTGSTAKELEKAVNKAVTPTPADD